MATTAYHGLDTNSNPVDDTCHDDFYLGEMGMGAYSGDSTVYNSYYCISQNNRGDTGNTNPYSEWMYNNQRRTYGYWFLLGPMLANPDATASTYTCPNGKTLSGYRSYTVDTPSAAYAWGQKQAQAANNAWLNDYPYTMGQTIFGDVEQGETSGWYPSSWTVNGYNAYELNQQVIIGFIQELFNLGRVGGIYSSQGEWDTATNSWTGLGSYTSHEWAANWPGISPSTCLPAWAPQGFGGVSPQIWQYYGSNTFDADAAISLPS